LKTKQYFYKKWGIDMSDNKVVSSSQYLAGFLVSVDLKKIIDVMKEKKLDKRQYNDYIAEYDNFTKKFLTPIIVR